MANQNSQLRIRTQVAHDHDEHIVKTPHGDPVLVRRVHTSSYFKEDAHTPLYGSIADLAHRQLRAVYEGQSINVWLTISVAGNDTKDMDYKLWDSFGMWLPRIIPAVEDRVSSHVAANLHWHIDFPEIDLSEDLEIDASESVESIKAKIVTTTTTDGNIIQTDVTPSAFRAFYRPENYAEQAILSSFVKGIADSLEISFDTDELIRTCIPDSDARQFHVLTGQDFSDYVADSLPSEALLLEEFDDTLSRVGLAWRVRDRSQGDSIKGVCECTKFLNKLVDSLWSDIRDMLQPLDRLETLTELLRNIETIRQKERLWENTVRAVLSTHSDRNQILNRISEEKFRYSSGSLTSRILVEMALCECAPDGGQAPGKLELSRLMAKVSLMNEVGGWSDGINEGAIAPEVRLTPLGLVLIEGSFYDGILQPSGYDFEHRRLTDKAERYDELFGNRKPVVSTKAIWGDRFSSAWNEEFGFTIDEGRVFIDTIEEHALKEHSAIITFRGSDLMGLLCSELPKKTAAQIFDALTLAPRSTWNDTSSGITWKDFVPWRYRRKLSAIYRPVLQVDESNDPLYLIAPGFIRHGYSHRVICTHNAEYEPSHFNTASMKAWIGFRRDEVGHEFNKKVSGQLKTLGWSVETEIRLSAILKAPLDRDYGDIDVFAWQIQSGRVLVIECKNLLFAKTPGEVARQLREFRGEVDSQGNPDRLKRHLDRIDILLKHRTDVENFVRFADFSIESILVFRNPVPMIYSKAISSNGTRVCCFDQLDHI